MISRIFLFLKSWPLHVLLLPIFFIAGSYNQYAGLLSTDEVLSTLLYILASLLVAFGLLFWVYKDKIKAGVVATALGIFYLFFGDIKEALSNFSILEFISHYKTLLPLILIISIFLFIKLFKAKPPLTLNLFLNILLGMYCFIEVLRFAQLSTTKPAEWTENKVKLSNDSTKTHPNIYYIILDCYPNSGYQQDQLGVDSNELDSYLSNKGFFIVKNSTSNYNFTSFSMAANFNMGYLNWINDQGSIRPQDYNSTYEMIERSVVFEKLIQEQYQFNNLSIFDLPGNPSIRKADFLTVTSREIILHNTFYKCLKRDVLSDMFPVFRSNMEKEFLVESRAWHKGVKPYNKFVLDSLLKTSLPQENKNPLFVYAHLIMPHSPYFFDSTGKPYPDEMVFAPNWSANKEMFKNYIGYTNRQAAMLLDTLFQKTKGRDIIIVQSDHGLSNLNRNRKQDAFRNYSAFYFPDKDYKLLYDSMSNVNTFRIIFNKYFGQQLSLLKDSTIYLR